MTAGMRVAAGAPRWSTPLVHVDIRRARSLKRAEDGCACDCAEPEDDVGSLPAEEAVQVEEERERERERERDSFCSPRRMPPLTGRRILRILRMRHHRTGARLDRRQLPLCTTSLNSRKNR